MDSLRLARRFAKSTAGRSRELEGECEILAKGLEKVSLAYVETVALLEGFLESMPVGGTNEIGESLAIAIRRAWEQLEMSGIRLDGEVGEPFDASRHRAVKEVDVPGSEGLVHKVLGRGVSFRDRRFRPADVLLGRRRNINHRGGKE